MYPANPFRPLLGTQGLRNLQLEVEKATRNLRKHWFYGNADSEALQHLTPKFDHAQASGAGTARARHTVHCTRTTTRRLET